jgi:mycothiol synthase
VAEIRSAGWDDLDAVHSLLAARSRAAFGTSDVQLEHLRDAWKLPSFEVGRDNWAAVDDGAIVGYAAIPATQHLEHAARDAAVGDALLTRALERARERGFDHVSVTAVPEDRPLSDLVRRHGFVRDREILRMWKQLNGADPQPAWPPETSVRTYTDADSRRVHTLLDEAYETWDETYVAREHDDWLAFMTRHDEFDPDLWFLVERDGDLVAAALHWKEHRGDGWVKDIVVRESERGRGLGKALLLHAFDAYARRGASRVGLKVDSTNPTGAPQLYERVGFEIDRRYEIWATAL